MKNIIFSAVAIIAIFCTAIIPPAAGSDATGIRLRVPSYDLSGIEPIISFRVESKSRPFSFETKNKKLVEEAAKSFDIYVTKVREYRIDSDKNGVVDLVHREYDFQKRIYRNGKDELEIPAHTRIELYIDKDCPGEAANRVLIDEFGYAADGKQLWGADGKFDIETFPEKQEPPDRIPRKQA